MSSTAPGRPRHALVHVRAPRPLHFPVQETVPESKRHLLLRTGLFQVLQLELAGRCAIGSDQFVFWNASDPKKRLAPDVFVHMGQADHVFDSWKTWEHGAPQLGIEIISEHERAELAWQAKLARYGEAGFQEVVYFDPAAAKGERLRIWDNIEGDLVERVVQADRSPCELLGLWWLVRDDPELGGELLVSRDAKGTVLLPGPEARGEARGRAEGEREAARKLLASGMSRERVAAILGLEPDDF